MPKIWIEFTDDRGHSTAMLPCCIDVDDCKSVRGIIAKVRSALIRYPSYVENALEEAKEKENLPKIGGFLE